MESHKKKELIHMTSLLSDQQFRVFFMSLLNQNVKDTIKMNRTLFTATLTDEQAYYKAIQDIVDKLGGIEEVESICECFGDCIPCTGRLRNTLNIEPFEYKEESGITISRTMI